MKSNSGPIPLTLSTLVPAERFATLLRAALNEYSSPFHSIKKYRDLIIDRVNVQVTGDIFTRHCDYENTSAWKQVYTLVSPTLVELMNYTLKNSDNLYAETFLRQIGKTVWPLLPVLHLHLLIQDTCTQMPSSTTETTADLGMIEVEHVLTTEFGVENGSFVQDDGSGLSRHNLLSPDAMMEVLHWMWSSEPNGCIFYIPSLSCCSALISTSSLFIVPSHCRCGRNFGR